MSNDEERSFPARYLAKLIGALLGIAAGISFLVLGFWKTLLIIVLALAGWFIGGRAGENWPARIRNVVRRILKDQE